MTTPLAAVIIPAHNEELTIAACLTALLDGLQPGQVEILVVCNGCTDSTATRARAFGRHVRVCESPTASKAAALNWGDSLASAFPRAYVDADVVLSGKSLLAVAEVLRRPGGPLAAAPTLEIDVRGRTWSVRAYYRVWTRLPYISNNMIGSGVYALSAAGRRRFGRFPDMIADDLFVYRQFESGERVAVPDAAFTIRAPATLRQLVHVHGRRRAGNIEWATAFPDANPRTAAPAAAPALVSMARDPRWWPSLAVYGFVVALGRAKGRWKVSSGQLGVWERDEGSRQAQGAPENPGIEV